MDPQGYINTQIANGRDIVFGEEHSAIGSTMTFFAQTIEQNPNRIAGVSLEFPPEVQPYIEQAARGEISADAFSKQMRITLEQSYLETAGSLLGDGRITQEQYDDYEIFINDRVTGVLTGDKNLFTEAEIARDQEAFGTMFTMIGIAEKNGVPVAATDIDREFPVLMDMGEAIMDDWLSRVDDTSDYALFKDQFDVTSDKQFLVHRGAGHTEDINGHATGLDDFLEREGRNVVNIGNYSSLEMLTHEVNRELNDYGNTIEEGTDMTIIGTQGFESSQTDIFKNPSLAAPKL
ncbi:MAG: hypothetical protein GW778_02150 [Alphaproteobacteria bacterium]|nr:hypothetical protein [Alphaproteobacteria bacterium]